MEHFNAVILAGGSGTRLWPLSTPSFPKQFLPLPNGRSLIQESLARVETLFSPERAWVVTGRNMAELVHEHLPSVPVSHILGEPVGRNTAAAIGWAAVTIGRQDPQAIMAVLTADHVITKIDAFNQALRLAAELAGEGHLVTLGIKPTGPETGSMGTARERATLDELWPTLQTISIDYGVLEKTKNLVVIPVDIGWNDVGNWEQYGSLFPADEQTVRSVGHHQGLGSQNIFVYNNTARQVFTIGMEGVVVIEMEDKTVICHKDSVQRVKEFQDFVLLISVFFRAIIFMMHNC